MLLKFCPTLCPFTTSTLNLQFFCVRNTFSILALIVHYPVLPGGLKLKEVDWTVGPATTDCVTDTLHYEQCRFQPSTSRNVFSASSIMYLYECVWHFLGWLIGWEWRDYFGGRFPRFAFERPSWSSPIDQWLSLKLPRNHSRCSCPNLAWNVLRRRVLSVASNKCHRRRNYLGLQ